MYEIVKKVIESSKYDLSDILQKINTLWVRGDITEEQKDELTALAQDNADTAYGIGILQKLEDLEKRIRALETPTLNETALEYVPGKWYYNGDKVIFDDAVYICTAPAGQVCTWSPVEYPNYWEKENTEEQSDA